MRIKTIGSLNALILALLAVILIATTLYINQKVKLVDRAWRDFEEQRSEKARLMNIIYAELGYTGLIHDLKNYVLRRKAYYYQHALAHQGGVLAALQQYRAEGTTKLEDNALQQIENTLHAYGDSLALAEKGISEGLSPEQIDSGIRVNDREALGALSVLEQLNDLPLASGSQITARLSLVNSLRRVIGYGGMIHNFKNLVLRHDPALATAVMSQVKDAEELISRYLALDINNEERAAIESIQRVIREYAANVPVALRMGKQEHNAAEIDRVVRVDDTPASKGFSILNRSISQYMEGQNVVVEDSLASLKYIVRNTIGFAVALTLLFILLPLWYLHNRIIRPIQHLTASMRQLSSGNLNVNISVGRYKDEIGDMAHAMQVFRDNEQKRMLIMADKQALDLQFESIINHAADSIVIIDRNGTVKVFNSAAEGVFGYTAENVIGRNVSMLMPGPHAEKHDQYIEKYLRTGEQWILEKKRELNGLHRDGSVFPMEITVAETLDKGSQLFVGIMRDISERKEREEQLKQAKEQAESANVAKSQFLANMSHELRTPLNAIIGYSELLMEEWGEDDGSGEWLADIDKIHSAGKHLLALISDILDLSKIEAGRMELFIEAVDLQKMLTELVDVFRPVAQNNGSTIDLVCSDNIGISHTDETKLRQILFNLLSNAAKFTKNGHIELNANRELSEHGEVVVFKVIDSGIGMVEEQFEKIFEPFSQADSSTSRRYGGTGLGLDVSRRFSGMMGGEIGVTSEPGKGSCFTVTLPVVVNVEGEGEPAISDSAMEQTLKEMIMGREGSLVLVVDDDPNALGLIARQLSENGFRVVTALGGESGLLKARKLSPDVITLDIMMPDLDGWSVLKSLKSEPETANIPVVLCTIVDDKNRGFALGASDYLTKPIRREQLMAALNKYNSTGLPGNALVVEDDPATREVLKRNLEASGWTVREAANGIEGLKQLKTQRPDMILLDLVMPEMDGFEFIENLRQDEQNSNIPVLVLTAKDLTAGDFRRLNGYMENVIAKNSYDTTALLQEIENQVRRVMSRP